MKKISIILSIISIFVITTMITLTSHASVTMSNVQSGDSGSLVTAIQYLLKSKGYSLSVDGSFGSGTKSAVVSFQSKNSLDADGVVGPNTWKKLFVTVSQGSSGDAVKALQTLLNKHNYSLSVDGDFGSGTKSAVVSFQSKNSLDKDGIVGPTTWSYLVASSSNNNNDDTGNIKVSFNSSCNSSVVSSHSISVIKSCLKAANLTSGTISSTLRTSTTQATAMYDNCVSTGATAQKNLYGTNGDKVIDVYISGKSQGLSRSTIINNMKNKIEVLWPSIVSNHCVSPSSYASLNVIDISYSSISNDSAFKSALNSAVSSGKIKKFIDEPNNGCFHIEIPQ